ncbi:hypothetical protein CPB84DRAFT_855566 [Gymnopilus junonius]|uniref:Uncharacterized protein n=1 Tax=Gymnopilus junonius TaxID=109634 RepID=A0A9P5TEP1_GYMJU|nr:hypothetical protein CPB84DRAFT_855566 [Gymnopilus junonius]
MPMTQEDHFNLTNSSHHGPGFSPWRLAQSPHPLAFPPPQLFLPVRTDYISLEWPDIEVELVTNHFESVILAQDIRVIFISSVRTALLSSRFYTSSSNCCQWDENRVSLTSQKYLPGTIFGSLTPCFLDTHLDLISAVQTWFSCSFGRLCSV